MEAWRFSATIQPPNPRLQPLWNANPVWDIEWRTASTPQYPHSSFTCLGTLGSESATIRLRLHSLASLGDVDVRKIQLRLPKPSYLDRPADVSIAGIISGEPMRKVAPRVAALLILSIASLLQAQTKTLDKPNLVVVDDWWNIDYVKSSCLAYAQESHPCTRAPEETVTDFESRLEVAFATERECHGLALSHFTPEMVQVAVKNPTAPATGAMLEQDGARWQLMLDLDGHSQTQAGQTWTLSNLSTKKDLNGRITTPAALSRDICKIAKVVGGTP